MAEILTEHAIAETRIPEAPRPCRTAKPRSTGFTYYIHDNDFSLRLQLVGDLTSVEVIDLTGCWKTSQTILGSRKLILDVRCLQSVDEGGNAWLAAMAREGAEFLPGPFTSSPKEVEAPKLGWRQRLLGASKTKRGSNQNGKG